jgi:nitrogen fixation/metabolism regulation signal transduction histidine kinase
VQEKFSRIKFGTKNEKIEYLSNDEIGGLVAEYNRMVDELEKSVELLSKSEREIAWREMARQVAHEIKNPLTPMKLSIQQLQRAWNDRNENIDEYLNKVSRTLIEQIENLSSIATEFSNFAQMPKFKASDVNIVQLLQRIIQLFSESNVNIRLVYSKTEDFIIRTDKDQLSRVVINLITNAIQAIPENRKGYIELTLLRLEGKVQIDIKDNGKGIPLEMIDKMFQPNFTTKSSGMGLGLAISKNIIESMGGEITFETWLEEGTKFKILLPLLNNINQ